MSYFEVKRNNLKRLSEYRSTIIHNPPLRNLFLELTLRCNENCIHCGSKCSEFSQSTELTFEQYKKIFDDVKRDFDISTIKLDITGGEPLLRKDFFEVMHYANKLGYQWGMTSNGTLITDNIARELYQCGMRTIAISIDGLEGTHDRLRGRNGAFRAAVNGIKALVRANKFEHIQITSVINHQNIVELQQMFEMVNELAVTSWRVINIEPIGRAKEHPELLLSKEEYGYLFDFIREKRINGFPITYGCSHFLGLEYERLVRDWYFLCNAGLYTASITTNGNIVACLDIERRPELIQGNILKDRLKDVWTNGFEFFRNDLSRLNENCNHCDECQFCHGGAFHSWNFEKNEQQVCFKDILF